MLSTLIKGKVRLWVEYALVGIIVALLAVSVVGYIQRMQMRLNIAKLESAVNDANSRLRVAEQVNQDQEAALTTIRDMRALDSEVLTGLSTDLNSLRVRDRRVSARIDQLEKTNAAVRAFLDASLPADGCMLDQSCAPVGEDGRGDGEAAPGADADVPAPARNSREDRARPRR